MKTGQNMRVFQSLYLNYVNLIIDEDLPDFIEVNFRYIFGDYSSVWFEVLGNGPPYKGTVIFQSKSLENGIELLLLVCLQIGVACWD